MPKSDSPWGIPKTTKEEKVKLLTELFEIPEECSECGADDWIYVIPGNPAVQGAWGCRKCGHFLAVKWKTPKREQRAWVKAKSK